MSSLTPEIFRGMIAADTEREGKMFTEKEYWPSRGRYTKDSAEGWTAGDTIVDPDSPFHGMTVGEVLTAIYKFKDNHPDKLQLPLVLFDNGYVHPRIGKFLKNNGTSVQSGNVLSMPNTNLMYNMLPIYSLELPLNAKIRYRGTFTRSNANGSIQTLVTSGISPSTAVGGTGTYNHTIENNARISEQNVSVFGVSDTVIEYDIFPLDIRHLDFNFPLFFCVVANSYNTATSNVSITKIEIVEG